MESGMVWIFLLILIAFGAIGYFVWKAEQERKARLAAFAASCGAEYYEHAADLSGGWFNGPSGLDRVLSAASMLGNRAPFGQGHSRRASHAILFPGEERLLLTALDYEYKITTSNGKSTQTTTYPFRLVIGQLKMMLPSLELEPENFGHRIAEKFGMREIEFEMEEFNRKYFVRSPDREEVFALLHPEMMENLLELHPLKLTSVGPWLMLVEPGKQDVPHLQRMLGQANSFVRHIPEYLWRDRAIS